MSVEVAAPAGGDKIERILDTLEQMTPRELRRVHHLLMMQIYTGYVDLPCPSDWQYQIEE